METLRAHYPAWANHDAWLRHKAIDLRGRNCTGRFWQRVCSVKCCGSWTGRRAPRACQVDVAFLDLARSMRLGRLLLSLCRVRVRLSLSLRRTSHSGRISFAPAPAQVLAAEHCLSTVFAGLASSSARPRESGDPELDSRLRGNERSLVYARSCARDFLIQLSNSQRSAALFLCGAGYAVVRPPSRGLAFRTPSSRSRGWSAKRRTSLPQPRSLARTRAPLGAPSRLFCPRGRASVCRRGALARP